MPALKTGGIMHGFLFLPAQSSDTLRAQLQQEHVLAELEWLLEWAAEAIGCKLVSHSKSIMCLWPNLKFYKPQLDICFNLTLGSLFYFLSWPCPTSASALFVCTMQNFLKTPCLAASSEDCPEGYISHQAPYKVKCPGRDDCCRLSLILTGSTHLNWPEMYRFVCSRK